MVMTAEPRVKAQSLWGAGVENRQAQGLEGELSWDPET